MAWTTPQTVVADSTELTAALWNEQVRDNSAYLKAEADDVGLVHIVTASNSGTNTLSVNNCFSSDYQNYRLVWTQTAATSANAGLLMKMRVSGSDATNDWYGRLFRVAASTSISTIFNASGMLVGLPSTSGQANGFGSIEISRPNDAARTMVVTQSWYAANTEIVLSAGSHDVATAYDGFSFIGDSGMTYTITVRVYGYKDA